MRSKVKMLHLINGPPIIAKVSSSNPAGFFDLEDPILFVQDEKEEHYVAVPMLPLAKDNTIAVKEEHILFMYTPTDEITEKYANILLNTLEEVPSGEPS